MTGNESCSDPLPLSPGGSKTPRYRKSIKCGPFHNKMFILFVSTEGPDFPRRQMSGGETGAPRGSAEQLGWDVGGRRLAPQSNQWMDLLLIAGSAGVLLSTGSPLKGAAAGMKGGGRGTVVVGRGEVCASRPYKMGERPGPRADCARFARARFARSTAANSDGRGPTALIPGRNQ
eukprot:5188135-Pyramimonas_sp.AAC.5